MHIYTHIPNTLVGYKWQLVQFGESAPYGMALLTMLISKSKLGNVQHLLLDDDLDS